MEIIYFHEESASLFSTVQASENEMAGTVSIAVIQSRYRGSRAAALDHADLEVRRAASLGARIICLQELFAGPYFCQEENTDHFNDSESIPGPTTERFCALAAELEVVLIVPLFERAAPGVFFNSAAVIDADGVLLGAYRKMHIPDDPHFYEKYYFSPGDGPFRAWKTRWGAIGVLICWDQWFPEAARLTAMAGAEILFYPTAIGTLLEERDAFGEAQRTAWDTVQVSHAITNGCYVAAANRVGLEEGPAGSGIEFWGRSFVADPAGKLLARASDNDEEVLIAEVDRRAIEKQRVNWPFFRDRRIDAYGGLMNRFGCSSEGEEAGQGSAGEES